jgi:SAM-dependent methyltransferase
MLSRIRRFGFRLLYNECAFSYDFVSRAVSLGQWRNWQRSVLQFLLAPAAGVVLELAQGTGDLQIDLQKAGYRTIGLDLSRSMSRLAMRKLTRDDLRAALVRGEAARLPIRTGSIAALVCTFPTSFILQPKTQRELERVLKTDGQAVIVLSGLLMGGGIVRRLIRGLYRLSGQAYPEIDEEELRQLFSVPGLSVEMRIVRLEGSVVQIVVLRKIYAAARKPKDHNLDLAREA